MTVGRPIRSSIDPNDATFLANEEAMLVALAEIDALLAQVVGGGGSTDAAKNARSVARLRSRGKLLPRERIDLLLGLNYAVGVDEEGHGHRFSIEGGLPIYQNLRGPQLRSDWRIGGAWQWTF